MSKEKTVEELQVEHSRLCALSADNGIVLSDDLTAEFDTALVGRAINSSIGKLLTDAGLTVGVAKDPEVEQSAPAPKKKKTKAAKATTEDKPVANATQQEKAPMATKTKAKKTVAKKAAPKKGAAKKSAAKKAAKGAAKKGAVKKKSGPRADSLTSKIVARLKNGGITRAEILKMTGWKAVSVQQLAASAGLTVKKSAERPFVYKAA